MQSLKPIINQPKPSINGELLEKVVLGNDLSGLSPIQKVEYVKNLCQTLNLNLVTKPIQLLRFQGKEVPYFTKDASEQLRKNNKVSISKVETKLLDGGLYVVTVYATTPDARQDCSTAAVVIKDLKGDALANALMKAETKAKRRVTLSICGLGFMDELETETIPDAKKIDIDDLGKSNTSTIKVIPQDLSFEISRIGCEIQYAKDLNELKTAFEQVKKLNGKVSTDQIEELIVMKDIRKEELSQTHIDFIEEE